MRFAISLILGLVLVSTCFGICDTKRQYALPPLHTYKDLGLIIVPAPKTEVQISEDCEIIIDGVKATLKDLKEGMDIKVFINKEGKAIKIIATSP